MPNNRPKPLPPADPPGFAPEVTDPRVLIALLPGLQIARRDIDNQIRYIENQVRDYLAGDAPARPGAGYREPSPAPEPSPADDPYRKMRTPAYRARMSKVMRDRYEKEKAAATGRYRKQKIRNAEALQTGEEIWRRRFSPEGWARVLAAQKAARERRAAAVPPEHAPVKRRKRTSAKYATLHPFDVRPGTQAEYVLKFAGEHGGRIEVDELVRESQYSREFSSLTDRKRLSVTLATMAKRGLIRNTVHGVYEAINQDKVRLFTPPPAPNGHAAEAPAAD